MQEIQFDSSAALHDETLRYEMKTDGLSRKPHRYGLGSSR